MGTAIKHPVMSDRVKPSFVIFDIQHQSARMSKIINDDLTQSGTGCFIAVPICHQWASTVKLYSTQLQYFAASQHLQLKYVLLSDCVVPCYLLHAKLTGKFGKFKLPEKTVTSEIALTEGHST